MNTINPDDIRVGDIVQRTYVTEQVIGPLAVTATDSSVVYVGDSRYYKLSACQPGTFLWELLKRPVEKPALGSRWKHKNHRYIFDGTHYVLLASASVSNVNISLQIPWTNDDDNEFKLDES